MPPYEPSIQGYRLLNSSTQQQANFTITHYNIEFSYQKQTRQFREDLPNAIHKQ